MRKMAMVQQELIDTLWNVNKEQDGYTQTFEV